MSGITFSPDDLTRWKYNIKDIGYTLEVATNLLDVLADEDQALQDYWKFKQHELYPAVNTMSRIGAKVDLAKKEELSIQLEQLAKEVEEKIIYIVGEPINIRSGNEVKSLFKDLLGVKPVINRKTKSESFGSDAMLVYLDQYPLYKVLITLILEYRSINIFLRTFVRAKISSDGFVHTAYNVSGTKSERLASRKNAFNEAMNMQNIPSKGKIDLKYSLMDYSDEEESYEDSELDADFVQLETEEIESGITELPNCKSLFICEEDETWFDIDLAAADARIVAWVTGCKFLTELFEDDDADIYSAVASEYYKRKITKKDKERQIFKAVIHGSHYLGKAATLAAKAGLLVHDVDRVQKYYFSLCHEIPAYHNWLEKEVFEKRYLRNCWGARGWFLDTKDPMILNKAMAWVGSSPVLVLINKALVRIAKTDPKITLRLQVHDSLAGTFNTSDLTAPARIVENCKIALPFEKPRIIPVQIKTSTRSYGECDNLIYDTRGMLR